MKETALKLEPADPHAPPANCANCGAAVSGKYCHECGQEVRLHAPSFGEFAHEFVGHYVALEGRLWATMGRLLFRPGALTNEYLAGRRKRYVEPLRLYLTLSVLFFAVLKFGGVAAPLVVKDVSPASVAAPAPREAAHAARNRMAGTAQPVTAGQAADRDRSEKEAREDEDIPDNVLFKNALMERVWSLPQEKRDKVLKDGFYSYAPYAMFALMPLFALYLKLLYLGSGRKYGEHLLFALHANAFAFVICAAFTLADGYGLLKFVLVGWLIAYLPWAMQRVYGGRKLRTGLRWAALMLMHGLSLGIAIIAALGAGVATAH